MEEYKLREMNLVPLKDETYVKDLSEGCNISDIQTVGAIVESQIVAIESEYYDKDILLDIWKNL